MDNDILKMQIMNIMHFHDGEENSITRRQLCAELGLVFTSYNDRRNRRMISEIRHFGFPILFSTGNPGGYYMPRNHAELRAGIEKMRSYVIDECQIIAAWKHKGDAYLKGEKQENLL